MSRSDPLHPSQSVQRSNWACEIRIGFNTQDALRNESDWGSEQVWKDFDEGQGAVGGSLTTQSCITLFVD